MNILGGPFQTHLMPLSNLSLSLVLSEWKVSGPCGLLDEKSVDKLADDAYVVAGRYTAIKHTAKLLKYVTLQFFPLTSISYIFLHDTSGGCLLCACDANPDYVQSQPFYGTTLFILSYSCLCTVGGGADS